MGSGSSSASVDVNRSQVGAHGTEPTTGVLVFNHDPELRLFLNKALYLGDMPVTWVRSREEVHSRSESGEYGILLVGIDSPEAMEFLSDAVEKYPAIGVVAIARTATPELVHDVMKMGVADFLFGTMNVRSVAPRLGEILEAGSQASFARDAGTRAFTEPSKAIPAETVDEPKVATDESDPFPIVSCSKRMERLLEIAQTIAPTQSTALIQGESGTGKELIAKRIHKLSKRRGKPFVEVNCGALPPNLLESQLFGHERGSFTGAVQRQLGLFEIADEGTIFFDEIGEMSLDMQVKLLRVLQFREFRRIGGSEVIKVDVRVIAATNKDLNVEVKKMNFRADLFYRLNVICLNVPPLRERPEEIPDLVSFFCERLAVEQDLERKGFTDAALQRLQKYCWNGNVRELENAVERLILLARGDTIEADDVEEHLDGSVVLSPESPFSPTLTLDDVKKLHIARVLEMNDGNKMKTARILEINVKTLYNLIKSLGLTVN